MTRKEQPGGTEPQQPTPRRIRARSWKEAHEQLHSLIGDRGATLGSGYDYPAPYAYFYTDALSGEGMGYRVYTTRDGRLAILVATIRIGPDEEGGEESRDEREGATGPC